MQFHSPTRRPRLRKGVTKTCGFKRNSRYLGILGKCTRRFVSVSRHKPRAQELTFLIRLVDYTKLLSLLPSGSTQYIEVRRKLAAVKPRAEAAQKKETSEMLDKLKGIGNSILGAFVHGGHSIMDKIY